MLVHMLNEVPLPFCTAESHPASGRRTEAMIGSRQAEASGISADAAMLPAKNAGDGAVAAMRLKWVERRISAPRPIKGPPAPSRAAPDRGMAGRRSGPWSPSSPDRVAGPRDRKT
jgi:hypothetical protein